MTENELQGFDNLENDSEIDSDLDALLGDTSDASSHDGGAAQDPEDEKLDAFFEDLSTIDDLDDSDLDDVSSHPAPATITKGDHAAGAHETSAKKPKKAKRQKKRGGGLFAFLWRWTKRFVILGLLIWGGQWLYMQFFPTGDTPPWETEPKSTLEESPSPSVVLPTPFPKPAAPPKVTRPKAVKPKPARRRKPRVAQRARPQKRASKRPILRRNQSPTPSAKRPARFGIQAASCLSDSCVRKVENTLRALGWQTRIHSQEQRNELVEVLSEKRWPLRIQAEDWAERINNSPAMAGFAHVVSEPGGHRVSMGSFVDLARAIRVRDTINQRFPAQLLLNSHLISSGYALRRIVGEGFVTRVDAEQALSRFLRRHPSYVGAFVVDL